MICNYIVTWICRPAWLAIHALPHTNINLGESDHFIVSLFSTNPEDRINSIMWCLFRNSSTHCSTKHSYTTYLFETFDFLCFQENTD